MENMKIRRMIFNSGLKHKQIAAEMGIRHETLSRKLAGKLSKEDKKRIEDAIHQLIERTA